LVGFIVGTIVGQFCGAWVYWRVRGKNPGPAMREALAAAAAGLVTAAIATAVYVPLDVHSWLGGIGAPWGASAFLALIMGVCQAVLFRGRPLRPAAGVITQRRFIAACVLIVGLILLAALIPGIRALVFGPRYP
jgi:hypothetical protein